MLRKVIDTYMRLEMAHLLMYSRPQSFEMWLTNRPEGSKMTMMKHHREIKNEYYSLRVIEIPSAMCTNLNGILDRQINSKDSVGITVFQHNQSFALMKHMEERLKSTISNFNVLQKENK